LPSDDPEVFPRLAEKLKRPITSKFPSEDLSAFRKEDESHAYWLKQVKQFQKNLGRKAKRFQVVAESDAFEHHSPLEQRNIEIRPPQRPSNINMIQLERALPIAPVEETIESTSRPIREINLEKSHENVETREQNESETGENDANMAEFDEDNKEKGIDQHYLEGESKTPFSEL
jgi:hypothetical protein